MQAGTGQIRLCVAILTIFFLIPATVASDQGDPVLAYYVERAGSTYESRNPLARGVSFSFRATSYYLNIGERGEVTRRDSSVTDYFYSFGQLDSSVVIVESERSQKPVTFDFPNIFSADYEFRFFPNDTGGTDLAIGFDTYTIDDPKPVGLVVIDRGFFSLRWLHLHYPARQYYRRFSRSFRFEELDGLVFADSVWEVSAKQGVFTTEFFRTETGITDIKIYR